MIDTEVKKIKNLKYLTLGLGITSGTHLINRFVVPVPDWLAIVLALLSVTLIIASFIRNPNKGK